MPRQSIANETVGENDAVQREELKEKGAHIRRFARPVLCSQMR